MGHRAGVKAVDIITEACVRLGIEALTLYTFSTENWKRPKKEVDALMEMLQKNLKSNRDKMVGNNIRFNVIGRLGELPPPLKKALDEMMRTTKDNTGMVLTLALNYGGRQELVDAFKAACAEAEEKRADVSSWKTEDIESFLYTRGLPDPDLVIRTSGEMRLSNFLLWQSAYSELYVTETLWPDFTPAELDKALKDFAGRERRFGG